MLFVPVYVCARALHWLPLPTLLNLGLCATIQCHAYIKTHIYSGLTLRNMVCKEKASTAVEGRRIEANIFKAPQREISSTIHTKKKEKNYAQHF